MTQQPDWEFLVNLGDVNPVDHGGLFVYRDRTGEYDPECERLEDPFEDCDECDDEPDEEDEEAHNDWVAHVEQHSRWYVYRVQLERHKLVTDEEDPTRRYLVPHRYDRTWPHSASQYQPWFISRGYDYICSTVGMDPEEFLRLITSEDPRDLALAYEVVSATYGWGELDGNPLHLTRAEIEARYKDGEI